MCIINIELRCWPVCDLTQGHEPTWWFPRKISLIPHIAYSKAQMKYDDPSICTIGFQCVYSNCLQDVKILPLQSVNSMTQHEWAGASLWSRKRRCNSYFGAIHRSCSSLHRGRILIRRTTTENLGCARCSSCWTYLANAAFDWHES